MSKTTTEVHLTYGPDSFVIGEDCLASGLFWTELALPDWELRYSYAPPSAYVPGNVLLAAVPESSAMAMRVVARGSSVADLKVQQTILTLFLSRFNATVSVVTYDHANESDATTIGGPWPIQPTIPQWGAVSPVLMGLYVSEATFSIPVNPYGAP